MPKATKQKRNGASHGTPYANSQPKASSNKIFKMNTNIGQHVLKNPGVAQAIVDKADLKQSDVRILFTTTIQVQHVAFRFDPSNRSHVGR
ncbi:Dimethyladenosine transferase [Xanthoria calcicola]